MSWPKLPRINPCLPCAIGNPTLKLRCTTEEDSLHRSRSFGPGGHNPRVRVREMNPLTAAERRRLKKEIATIEGLSTSGDCMTRGYVGGLKACEQKHNPSEVRGLKVGDVVQVRGRRGPHEVFTSTARQGLILVRSLSGGAPQAVPVDDVRRLSAGNPKRRGDCSVHIDMPGAHAATAVGASTSEVNPRGVRSYWWVWTKDRCAKVRREGSSDERKLVAQGFRKVSSYASHDEADEAADRLHGGRVGNNPKLMVLNPASDAFVEKVERILKRRLSAEERVQLGTARREYRTFHGRDPDSLVPVEVPKGAPRFVNLIGDVDRVDYTVRANSERRGRWTHAAGDHGRTAKKTKPALLVSAPGKKSPPLFAQRRGSEMYFKPTHGIMG